MSTLRKVISGGQTGVDQAALRAARECGLEIGGWCPPRRECEAGVIPAEFLLKETPQDRSANAQDVPGSQRTSWNVRDSDGTLVIGASDVGTHWTIECATRCGRPLLVCAEHQTSAKQIHEWITAQHIVTLNVAGPKESAAPGIGARVYALLRNVFGVFQSTPAE